MASEYKNQHLEGGHVGARHQVPIVAKGGTFAMSLHTTRQNPATPAMDHENKQFQTHGWVLCCCSYYHCISKIWITC